MARQGPSPHGGGPRGPRGHARAFTFRSYPKRARKLNDRILAVDKAEDGANFIDVFEWYRTEGYEERSATPTRGACFAAA